jgi:nudix-type nucleoside diphosphatase (YffH/AdpP family)
MEKEVVIRKEELLWDGKYPLKKITFELDGEKQSREIYQRGNAATLLLYNKEKKTVILTKQFRLASFVNGHHTGMLSETCAGMLDKDDPETCIRRESEEETGYRLKEIKKVFELYSSPGGLTEKVYYFVAPYTDADKVKKGGGLEEEHEHIDIQELPFTQAVDMMNKGEIVDAKTVVLLQYALIHQLI